ncbi:MAG: alternative ribosome rescue aminoacyl-tRNA hydrolase ArfB [Planctomycetota bacterium]
MPEPDGLYVKRGLVIPESELRVEVSHSGGPGGQNVNKVATRVSLRWRMTASRALSDAQRDRLAERLATRLTRTGELLVHVDESRSQARNREIARKRLAGIVRRALAVPRVRRATRPTRASRERRLGQKQRRARTKQQRRRPATDD